MRSRRRWSARVGTWLGALLVACTGASAAGQLPAAPDTFEARVSRVSDGDTLWVVPDATAAATPGFPPRRRKPVKLRLVGIDAPERCQAHGEAATQALRALVLDQRVTVRRRATDDYGRALGTLSLDGKDVAARLVQDGHAWSARRYAHPGPYAREDESARASRRGLFAHRDPQIPRDFRREHGPCPQAAAASP